MIPLFASRRTRSEIREWLALGEDVRDFVLGIVRAISGGDPARARALLEVMIREQAAGRAAHEASHLAGPRRAP